MTCSFELASLGQLPSVTTAAAFAPVHLSVWIAREIQTMSSLQETSPCAARPLLSTRMFQSASLLSQELALCEGKPKKNRKKGKAKGLKSKS